MFLSYTTPNRARVRALADQLKVEEREGLPLAVSLAAYLRSKRRLLMPGHIEQIAAFHA